MRHPGFFGHGSRNPAPLYGVFFWMNYRWYVVPTSNEPYLAGLYFSVLVAVMSNSTKWSCSGCRGSWSEQVGSGMILVTVQMATSLPSSPVMPVSSPTCLTMFHLLFNLGNLRDRSRFVLHIGRGLGSAAA